MKGNDDTGAIDNGKQEERKEDAHIRLMHPNQVTFCRTMEHFGWIR